MPSESILNTTARADELKKNLPVEIEDAKDVVLFFDIDYDNTCWSRGGRMAIGG